MSLAAMSLAPEPQSQDRPTVEHDASAEIALIRAAQDGDMHAFDGLVRLHSARIFNYLHHLVRQRHDAEDLTQQTFVKAYRSIQRFDPQRPLIHWLLTIARRTALNHFRSARRWEEIPDDTASAGPSPARQVERQDRVGSLWARARQLLSQREYEVMWLRFAEELSTKETAQVTGLTQIHVKVLVFRARQQLMKATDLR